MLAVQFQIGTDGCLETPGENFGERRLITVRRDEGELIAPDPRQIGVATERAQLLRQLAEHVIADRVTKRIVDLLEAIEVDAQHGQRFSALLRSIYRVREMFHERGAIGQIGERIIVCQVRNSGLGLLALGNILRKAEEVARFAGLVRYRKIPGCQDAGAVVAGMDDMLVEGLQVAGARRLVGERETGRLRRPCWKSR